jgi:hypothetical protein
MSETPEPSDQLPEEAPEGQVGEDEQDPGEGGPESSSGGRPAREQADVPEPREQATGNPDNAG